MAPTVLERYLERHAMVETAPTLPHRYRYVLTIPVFDEAEGFLDTVLANVGTADTLVVATINVPEGSGAQAQARTGALLESLRDRSNVLTIDRVTAPIPRRQGVGLARKLAADLACLLIHRGDIICPVIFMTDADVVLPEGYFEAATDLETGTVIYPFSHHAPDPQLELRADVYELHLRNYVAGLRKAASPYAFFTLGSTIAMHVDTYARVRGIPRRNAGEDFYLLNKAAKVDPVTSLGSPAIAIEARPSPRVPFGTGPALASMPTNVENFVSYSDEAFDELGRVATWLRAWALEGGETTTMEFPSRLAELGWEADRFERQYPAGTRRLRAVLEWFDGFRTMRFIRMSQRDGHEAPLLDLLRARLAMPDASPAELLAPMRAGEWTHVLGVDEAMRTLTTKPV